MLVINLTINDKNGTRLLLWPVDDQCTECLRDAKILAREEAVVRYRDAYIELEEPEW